MQALHFIHIFGDWMTFLPNTYTVHTHIYVFLHCITMHRFSHLICLMSLH